MTMRFLPIKTETANALRHGTDSYGLLPEMVVASTGRNTPCRHCLDQVPEGRPYLIAAYRPFDDLNPYAEAGPVFLCSDYCAAGGPEFPAAMLTSPAYIVRGYSPDERIIYGTGAVVPTNGIEAYCEDLLTRPEIAFLHIRSASNNCFHCRVERG